MKIITINLPKRYLAAMKNLQDLGFYPSRSEQIRVALHEFLSKELKMYKDLGDDTFKMLMRSRGVHN